MALIDVREDHEVNRDGTPLFPDHGYIPGAMHMSKGVIERDIERAIPNLDTSIIVYCSDGVRSAMVIQSLKKLGYTNVSSLKNGSQGWIAAGYSMEENSPIIEPTQIHKDHSVGFLKLTSDAKSEIQQITAVELKEKLDHHNEITLIDVREDHEWEAPLSLGGGHIPGAIHISRGMIDQDIAKKAPDLHTSIVVYCSGGFRGALVAQSLQKMGYTNVKSLEGGSRGWIAAGYQPLLEE
jgi:rhodanese-related sulfurtransferase